MSMPIKRISFGFLVIKIFIARIYKNTTPQKWFKKYEMLID